MKRSYVCGAALILLVLVAGCASMDSYGGFSARYLAGEQTVDKIASEAQASGEARVSEKDGEPVSADNGAESGERKKVYTAQNDLEVADVEKTKDLIREYVLGAGGF